MLDRLLKTPLGIRRRLTWTLTAINLIGTIIFAGLSYQAARSSALEDIDDNLCSAAEGARRIIPTIVIDQAEMSQRTEPAFTEAYSQAQTLLENYVEAARLEYIYAIAAKSDGTAFEVMSNLSPEQQAAGDNPMTEILLKPYELSPIMVEAAASKEQRIDIAEDEYGYFRSCIIPATSAAGVVMLYGADMEISAVNERLLRDLIANVGIGVAVLLTMLLIIRGISNSISRELYSVVKETEAVSRLVFLNEGERQRSSTLEVDTIFGSLYDMKRGLQAFSKFVPQSIVKQVVGSGKAEIGGEPRELSLLMTDVTDFTTISEQLEPTRVMSVMSEYFDRVVAPILAAHGTLDKYVGDAIFAYWNAPAIQSNHAVLCCQAALDAREASKALASEWEEIGRWPWKTRFGLHAGDTVFGNVGAPDRMDFTIIGSSVNLASRIEGLNKFYGTEILASGRIKELVGDAMIFRWVDRALPKGALDPIEIFELIGRPSALDDKPLADFLTEWEHAKALYLERHWSQALAVFSSLASGRPHDTVAATYVKRCEDYIACPPPADWDAVQRFDTK